MALLSLLTEFQKLAGEMSLRAKCFSESLSKDIGEKVFQVDRIRRDEEQLGGIDDPFRVRIPLPLVFKEIERTRLK
jgi:hypothetical protein